MCEGKCIECYPRNELKETYLEHDSLPLYQRRRPADRGFTVKLKMRRQEFAIDSRWIVPHSPLLSEPFNDRINVDFCSSVKTIHYINEYICKSLVVAMFGLEDTISRDDMRQFNDGQVY